MAHEDRVLVSAPNAAGEQFARLLKKQGVPFAAIVNNGAEFERMNELGVPEVVRVDTSEKKTWVVPEFGIGKAFLFERSLNLTCRYLQICRSWTSQSIYVITDSANPRLMYKGLGADYVIRGRSLDPSFLLDEWIQHS